MERINLEQFGFPIIELHGSEIGRSPGPPPLVILFDENHLDRERIKINLRDACILIDQGIVDFVGAEIPVEGVARVITQFLEQKGYRSVEDYWRATRDAGGDERIISEFDQWVSPPSTPMYFAACLQLLRPGIVVNIVEDPDAHAAYGRKQEELEAELEPTKLGRITVFENQGMSHIEADRQVDAEDRETICSRMRVDPTNHQREVGFLAVSERQYRETGARRATLLELGQYHNDGVSRLLVERGQAFIRIGVADSQ